MKVGYCTVTMATVFVVVVAPLCCKKESWNARSKHLNEALPDFIPSDGRCCLMYEGKEQFEHFNHCFQGATARHVYLNSFSTQPESAKYGMNSFSSLSPKEFRDLYLRASSERAPPFLGADLKELPAKFDWRDQAMVAPVQDQQVTRVKLVPQSEYPYQAKNGMCQFFSHPQEGVTVRNFTAYNFSGQEEAMKAQLVARGPLSAIVDAVSWQDYLGGIIQHHCSSHWPNHAVLVVGYDATGVIPFWIVQNSWGTDWGSEGYAYVKIGGNLCGIADSVAAVSV